MAHSHTDYTKTYANNIVDELCNIMKQITLSTNPTERTALGEEAKRMAEIIKNVVFCYRDEECKHLEKEIWTVDGKISRIGAPAVVTFNDSRSSIKEEWFKDGKLHRIDGPAVVTFNDFGIPIKEEWYVDGELQRRD